MLSTKYLVIAVLIFTFTTFSHATELTVSAAASLTDAFKEISQSYEAQYPGSKILLNFGASGALLQQIAKGAPVDVFASADQETMDLAEKQKLISSSDRQTFARNTLVVVVPSDSKTVITKLQDLTQPGIQKIAIGNPASVPVGRYAKHALDMAQLWSAVESKLINTQNVRQALDYVARSEVDAGFIYATDAAIMKEKVKIAFNVPLDVAISYPIAKLSESKNADEAKRFIGYIISPAGQAILYKYGFLKP